MTLRVEAKDAALCGLAELRRFWGHLTPGEQAHLGVEYKDELKVVAGRTDVFMQRLRAMFPGAQIVGIRPELEYEDAPLFKEEIVSNEEV